MNTDFETCADYTELLGYECVPYYQCHNGTIITDGAGLIDIRNGFGALAPEDSKCPGFLDVCCKDPDFIPPPPPKIKYSPQSGRRNQNGLGVRIQGFTESESQFGRRLLWRPPNCQSVPVWWITDCPRSYPHCGSLRGQVQTDPNRTKDQVWGVGHSEPDRTIPTSGQIWSDTQHTSRI